MGAHPGGRAVFQLHVMDSGVATIPAGGTRVTVFQLHVMDSNILDEAMVPYDSVFLSTPCNGFLHPKLKALLHYSLYGRRPPKLSTPCNGFEEEVPRMVEKLKEFFQLHVMDS